MTYKIITAILIIGTNFACAQDTLTTILKEGKRPSINNIYVDLYDEADNHSAIPISVIKGKKAGPVFTIISGIHGFEYPPIIAAQALIQEINPELLSGTIIIVPLSNPNSFYNRTPFLNPQDQLNLNRIFPGNRTGSITERIAHFMTHSIIAASDVFVDIHGGDANEDLLPFICYYNNESKQEQTKTAKRLTESSGFKYIVSYPYTLKDDQAAKYAFKQAVQDGKTALSIECGKLGNLQQDAVALIKKGVYNMLIEMKMYQKEPSVKTEFIQLTQQVYVKSKNKGVFYSKYSAGDTVEKGDIIGTIKNAFGKNLAKIKAPNTGIILYKIGTPPINMGETVMCIGYHTTKQ